VKTVAVREPLARALAPLADRIKAAFVYGSVAAGSDRAGSDIDLMVVGDGLDHATLYEQLAPSELQLARKVNPTVMDPLEWSSKRRQPGSFVSRVAERPRLFIVGTDANIP